MTEYPEEFGLVGEISNVRIYRNALYPAQVQAILEGRPMQNTLGWRRLIGWIAAIGAVLVSFDLLTGAEWSAMVIRMVVGV